MPQCHLSKTNDKSKNLKYMSLSPSGTENTVSKILKGIVPQQLHRKLKIGKDLSHMFMGMAFV